MLSRQDVLQNVLLKFVSFIILIYYVAFIGNAFISGKSLSGLGRDVFALWFLSQDIIVV